MSQPGRRRAATPAPEAGRRTAIGRRIHPTAVLCVVLPLLTLGALLLVPTHDQPDPTHAPTERALTQASLGCPAAPDGKLPALSVGTSLDDAEGDVDVRKGGSGAEPETIRVTSGEVATADAGDRSAVVAAEGDLAPGLLATRSTGKPLAATSCAVPRPETWFTGVGAGAEHSSTLELANPDGGIAVADVFVHTSLGLSDVPQLRGVTVRGHDVLRIDLAEAAPRRQDLSLQVVVSRGRLAASVDDQLSDLGTQSASADWLPPLAAPSDDLLLLGLPEGDGDDQLTLVNPSDDEVRAQVRIQTDKAAFAPEGLDEIRIEPQSTQQVTLTSVLRKEVGKGAVGVRITATAPIVASLRSVVDDDLSAAVPVQPLGAAATLVVPPSDGAGKPAVVLADAAGSGLATVTSWDARGRQLDEKEVELKAGSGDTVEVSPKAALVRVTPSRTTVSAALLVSGQGTAVLPFAEPVTTALVPDVRPGLL
jgi:hypothetical protein